MTIRLPFPGRFLALPITLALLAGCSGETGESVQELPDLTETDGGDSSVVLMGPPAQSEDIQRFRLQLWENVAPTDRCGECHSQTGGQSPTFARNDDINLAYNEANDYVDLGTPSMSRLATKVGEGHNCWLASDQACADIMETWITNWAGESAGDSTQIVLTAPIARAPGASRNFPPDSTAFSTTIHPLLTQYCSNCHVDTAAVPQSPFLANPDADVAYEAVKSKLSLVDPAASRLVVRLTSEFHNCWSNCTADGNEMLAAINAFVDTIPETEVDASLVTSNALTLLDGVVASGGGRNDGNVIALYEFKTLTGTTAFDTSGVEPALNLSFTGDITWVGGWGVRVGSNGRLQGTTDASEKLHSLITSTGEYSIEAWAVPGNVTQEDARIVSYSGGNDARNFTLGQTLYNYDFMARSSTTDANGNPALSTPDADEVLQASLQHVVATYDPTNGRRLYVNGELIDIVDDVESGNLNDWDDTFALVLGNEVSGDRLWQGILRLVAVHNRALTQEQIFENFDVGVGEQFFLLFGISDLIDVPEAYIIFEVSQFDSYSYLFGAPFFFSLDGTAAPADIPLQGMRIGVNGREPIVGQAYSNIDVMLGDGYTPEAGQTLSAIGTILGIQLGPDSDEFFLTFERLGDNTNVVVEAEPDPLPEPADIDPLPEIGIRQFDEINATMSALTGIPTAQADVFGTFSNVRQQLPSVPGIEGFLSSQQMGITQLAISYCNVLIEDTTARDVLFPAFDFNAGTPAAFDAAGRDVLLGAMVTHFIGDSVSTQPDVIEVRAELEALTDRLVATSGGADRTRTIAKSTCAAVLGSASMLIQ
ncbi:MAG: LamG domain-containing protein [Pseudomonadota bacterium]